MPSESEIEAFWDAHPPGERLVGSEIGEHENFFRRYDEIRYALETHIPSCLDQIDFQGVATLEIGLGQGTDSEQIIRRGARWSGLDLSQASVDRVRARLSIRSLRHDTLVQGSVLDIPFPDHSFDIVYSHGVLHHVPDVLRAQREIARVLRPGGKLVVMLYAKYSLNYLVSIAAVRRLGLLAMHVSGMRGKGMFAIHLAQARQMGLRRYLSMKEFIHHNTDGPSNPYSKVYSRREVERDFPAFRIESTRKEFMHAPPLPVHGLPGARWLGWHLWAHLVVR